MFAKVVCAELQLELVKTTAGLRGVKLERKFSLDTWIGHEQSCILAQDQIRDGEALTSPNSR